jgi:alkyl hydroperoxide reductase subunit AhpC
MKRTLPLIGLAILLLAGCRSNHPESGMARLSGTVAPAIQGYITVAAGPVLDSAKISKTGTFSLDMDLIEPVKGLVFIGKQVTDVHLEPGKELVLNINLATFPDKISYEGPLGPVNHYLHLAAKLDQKTAMDPNKLFAMLPADFIRYTDSIKHMKVTLLDEYAQKYSEIDPEFVSRTRSEFEFSLADQRIQYPDRHLLLTGVYPELPEGYYQDYLNNLSLDRGENLKSAVFKDFIQNYLDYKQTAYLAANPKTNDLVFPESVARFRVIHQEFKNQEMLDWLLYQAMNDQLANYGTAYSETFLTDFKVTCRNAEYIKSVETLAENLEKVGPGKEAPDFSAYTIEGKKVNLSDYFGKLLYIGFWSSWSEWSLLEIPYFENLRKELAGKDITFILISLDFEKDKNKWAATVNQNKLGGVQLFQDPKSTVLRDQYYLVEFPRYFLIGKDGKVISVFAPRPVENVRETLDRILEKSK